MLLILCSYLRCKKSDLKDALRWNIFQIWNMYLSIWKTLKRFVVPFWIGFNCLKAAVQLRGDSLLLTVMFSRSSWYSLDRPPEDGRMMEPTNLPTFSTVICYYPLNKSSHAVPAKKFKVLLSRTVFSCPKTTILAHFFEGLFPQNSENKFWLTIVKLRKTNTTLYLWQFQGLYRKLKSLPFKTWRKPTIM